jgi:hypothetical protein
LIWVGRVLNGNSFLKIEILREGSDMAMRKSVLNRLSLFVLFSVFALGSIPLSPSVVYAAKANAAQASTSEANVDGEIPKNVTAPSVWAENQEEADYLNQNPEKVYTLLFIPEPGGLLSVAQKVAIAIYTVTYERVEKIIVTGASKLPMQKGKFYRGQGKRQYKKSDIGKVMSPYESFKSVSKKRAVAENFLDASKKSQLLIIKAKTARDITSYSQGRGPNGENEEELLLLPGTRLRVDKIYPGESNYFNEETGEEVKFPIEIVEMTEVTDL